MDFHIEAFMTACNESIFSPYLSVISIPKKKLKPFVSKNPVVYFLFNGDQIVYIGSTTYFAGRLHAHSKTARMTFDSIMCVVYHQFGLNESVFRRAEEKCIKLFRPKRNIVGNPDYIKNGSSWVYLPDQTT